MGEDLNKAIEAFKKARDIEQQYLDDNGLQMCVIDLKISLNPNGNDEFFLKCKGGKIEAWTQKFMKQEIAFQNEGDPQLKIFSRRVKVISMKDLVAPITKITFCDVDGKCITLQDKKSIITWEFDVNTQFIVFS